MQKVVSGGPVRTLAARKPHGRTSGYNPIELSRSAVGTHPLVFEWAPGNSVRGCPVVLWVVSSSSWPDSTPRVAARVVLVG